MTEHGVRASLRTASALRLNVWCALLLAVAAVWTTHEVTTFDFVAMDDDINVIFNPHLGPPGTASVKWMVTDVAYMRRYVPMGWLAFSSVYEFSGLSPQGYHVANVAVHVLNTFLIFVLLLRLLGRYRPTLETSWRSLIAMVAAAMWSLHPFRAESVGWISGLLYGSTGFWALLSTLAYLGVGGATGRRRIAWLAGSAVAYALSITSYPMSVALPLVFVAIDLADQAQKNEKSFARWWRLGLEKLVFALPGAAVVAVTIFGRYEVTSFWPKPPSWEEFTLVQRVAQAFAVWGHYLWKTWWPTELTPAPTWLFTITPLAPRFVISAVVVLGISAALAMRASWRGALALWLAYLALLGPMLGLTEYPHFACDRYSYLAGIPLCAAVACGIAMLSPPWRGVALVAAVAGVTIWSGLQRQQLHVWRDSDALFARLIAASDDAGFKADNFRKWAMFHANRGSMPRARAVVEQARNVLADVSVAKAVHAAVEKVEAETSSASKVGPPATQLHLKLAMDFSRANRPHEADEHFRAAWKYAPGSPVLAFNWAIFSALNGNPRRALQLYSGALQKTNAAITPAARVKLLSLMAEAFHNLADPAMAASAIDEALRVVTRSPELAEQEASLRALRIRYATAPGKA